MAKNKYADDYETVVTRSEEGGEIETFVYRGDYFQLSLEDDQVKRFKTTSLLLLAFLAVVHVAAGFINNAGMRQFFVSLPYVIALLPMYYLAMGAFRLPGDNRKMRRDEKDYSIGRMKTASLALLILVGLAVIGEALYLLLNAGTGQWGLELQFLALEGLAVAAAAVIFRLQRQVGVEKIEAA